MRVSLVCAAVLALGCGDKRPPPPPPKKPPPPGLDDAEAKRLTSCLDALEHASGHPAGIAWIATSCSSRCELDVPGSIAVEFRSMLAFIVDRCAKDADPGESMWHLAKLTGDFIAKVHDRARNSHPVLADRLDEQLDAVSIRLHLESKVPSMYHLPTAATFGLPETEVYAVVTTKSISVGIAQWVRFSAEGATRTIGYGGAFPGKRVKLRKLREVATQLHATVSDDPNATAADRAPLLLADRGLNLARIRRVVRELGRARLGIDARGLVGEHPVHLNWIEEWTGTWLLYRPTRTLVRTATSTITVPHVAGAIDWSGVRAALAKAGGGDLALVPPPDMTVKDLTVVLDQIRTPDYAPSLFFSRAPGVEPGVAIAALAAAPSLDSRGVRRTLERRAPMLLDCYKPVLAADDRAEGLVSVRFAVDPRGRVTELAVGDELGAGLQQCVKTVVETLRFPRPRGREAAKVTVQLSFAAS